MSCVASFFFPRCFSRKGVPKQLLPPCSGFQAFTSNELQKATDYFNQSNVLGIGGFGTVYYGKLEDGREVAVKRIHATKCKCKAIEQLKKEIEFLSCLSLPNFVSLYGFNHEDLLLVFKYVSNGSLDRHLRFKPNKLPWQTRLNIAIETASALAYLHKSGIIHRDVNSRNLLLDENFNVKVADFGHSRFLPKDDGNYVSHVLTGPLGTAGYIDPEYFTSCKVSDKSDVYSFGVVLFELISSKPSIQKEASEYTTLAQFAEGKILDKKLEELVDPSLGFNSDIKTKETIAAVAEQAFLCVQCPKELRPSMKQVLETLEGIKHGFWGFNQIT